MSFWDESYNNELIDISLFLSEHFPVNKYEEINLNEIDDNDYLDAITIKAWSHFKYLFKHNLAELNEYTPFNQKYLKTNALPSLENLKSNSIRFLSLLMRIIHEYYFWNPNRDELPEIISTGILKKLDSIAGKISYNAQFLWIEHSMATAITRDLINSESFLSLRKIAAEVKDYQEKITSHKESEIAEFTESLNEHRKKSKAFFKQIIDLEIDLEKYETKSSEYKSDYNFVLLSKAFKNLRDAKNRELSNAQNITWFFTVLLTIPPIFSFLNFTFSWHEIGSGVTSLVYYLPLLTLEILMFYFMRLYYGEVRTIKTQLLQIEHRLSLCEFVHDYIDKKNLDKDNKASWDLFESLIFSPIQSTPDNIPSIIDGANAVADLAGKVMSKAKP